MLFLSILGDNKQEAPARRRPGFLERQERLSAGQLQGRVSARLATRLMSRCPEKAPWERPPRRISPAGPAQAVREPPGETPALPGRAEEQSAAFMASGCGTAGLPCEFANGVGAHGRRHGSVRLETRNPPAAAATGAMQP